MFIFCGGEKILEFMEWLGIFVFEVIKYCMFDVVNILSELVCICCENFDLIL